MNNNNFVSVSSSSRTFVPCYNVIMDNVIGNLIWPLIDGLLHCRIQRGLSRLTGSTKFQLRVKMSRGLSTEFVQFISDLLLAV